jgi:hypothetical protein
VAAEQTMGGQERLSDRLLCLPHHRHHPSHKLRQEKLVAVLL